MSKIVSLIASVLGAALLVYIAQSSYCHLVEKAISQPFPCPLCQGKEEVSCMTCFGRGESLNLENLSLGFRLDAPPPDIGPQPCEACQGSGKHACKACVN